MQVHMFFLSEAGVYTWAELFESRLALTQG